MYYTKFSEKSLRDLCTEIYRHFGFNDEESHILADICMQSELFGIESHGLNRLMRYYRQLKVNYIDVNAKPEIVRESPVSAVIDGHKGMGHLISYRAMELAMKKAEESGFGIVTVRNSNHFGIAGYYTKMACDAGYIGLSATNTGPLMVPTFGRQPMLGSNPLSFSCPAEPYPFLFDASTTVVPCGKLEMCDKKGIPTPYDWAMDETGRICRDAGRVLKNVNNVGENPVTEGGILPLGGAGEGTSGHKGYGFGMICEILTGILSCGETSSWKNKTGLINTCHCFAALRPDLFGDPEEIKAHLSAYMQELRDSEKADGATRIYTHGEKEYEAMKDRKENGINVIDGTVDELRQICRAFGIDDKKYLG